GTDHRPALHPGGFTMRRTTLCAGLCLALFGHFVVSDEAHHHAEQRATISEAAAAEAGIRIATAGAGRLQQNFVLHGHIEATSDGRVSVAAPFAGIVQSVAVDVGDRVAAGDVVATVRSSDSLQTYTIKAPRAGVVTERRAAPGGAAGSEPLLALLDLARVWAVVIAFPGDL